MTTLCPYDFEVLVSEDGKTARCTECGRFFELTPEGPKVIKRPVEETVANTQRPIRQDRINDPGYPRVKRDDLADALIAEQGAPIVSGQQYFEGTVISAKVKAAVYGDGVKITVRGVDGN